MIRILLADDHEVVRRGIRQVLRDEFGEIHVGEAASAPDVLDHLEREAWDLLMLDLNMPGPGGLEILGDVKRRKPQLPVLVVSAYAEEEFAVRCIRRGAAGYVPKASGSGELVRAARRALAGGRYVTAAVAEKLASVVGGEVADEPHAALSDRELQVLRLVARGLTLKEIASEFHLSEKTIATYRARISAKLDLSTNVELTRYALKHGLSD